MPFSDDMYNAEDQDEHDDQSFTDELSPSDGYFNGNGLSNMVQDPSIDTKPEPKTLIAPPQHSTSGGTSRSSLHSNLPLSPSASRNYAASPPPPPPPPPPQSSSHNGSTMPSSSHNAPSPRISRRGQQIITEHTPLMLNGPPPAYSPRSPLLEEVSGRRYSTFSDPNLEHGLLLRPEPESMGSPAEIGDERFPLRGSDSEEQNNVRYRKAYTNTRKYIKNALLILLVLAIIVIIMGSTFSHSGSDGSDEVPDVGLPPSKGHLDADSPYCTAASKHHEEMTTYEIPVGDGLTILQTTHNNDDRSGFNVQTVGEIRLRLAPEGSVHGKSPYLTIDTWVSHPELEVLKTWDVDSRLLKVSTPKFEENIGRRGPYCISLEITAWFPAETVLTDILIESVTLGLRVMEDIDVYISNRAKLTSITGHIWFPEARDNFLHIQQPISSERQSLGMEISPQPDFDIVPFESRKILVETVTGAITGCYPLMDFLGVSSQSGSIKINIVPLAASEESPAPADLEIQTSSGSIHAYLPLRDEKYPDFAPPPRDYITRVHSSSGSVTGNFYLGSESNFRSTTGSMHLVALPVLQDDDAAKSTFETHTISGSINVVVKDPIFISPLSMSDKKPQPELFTPIGSNDPYLIIPPSPVPGLFSISPPSQSSESRKLRTLKSTHSANSASVRVSYPSSWEGTVHQKTVSGSIATDGDGLRVVKARKGYAYMEVKARKGVESDTEGCWVEMGDVAGSLTFLVGREF